MAPKPRSLRQILGYRISASEVDDTLVTLRTALVFAEENPLLTVAEAVRSVHPHEVPDSDSRQYIPMVVLCEFAGWSPEGECAEQLAGDLEYEQGSDDSTIPNTVDFLREAINRIEAGERESHAP